MAEKTEMTQFGWVGRREALTALGTGVSMGLAGCGDLLGLRDDDDDIPAGGTPVLGMDTSPADLNPLERASAYALEIIEQLYAPGVVFHPETFEFKPWLFTDWELNPENVGTGDPTLIGELRDDISFNDGEPVTAEDVQFTVEYAVEQEVTGMVAASQFDALEEITVDSPDGTTVNYFFETEDAAWFSNILGSIILPKHIWEDVDDYSQYLPRQADEGVVGAGPFVLRDFDWENWLELEMRPENEIPWIHDDEIDWIHDDAPFIDGLRIRFYGSQQALEQAVLDGDVTLARGGFDVDRAVEATDSDILEVKESPDDGWRHHSYNVRRTPMDDPAFRQLLVLLNDKQWIVESLHRNIGAVEGSYATLPVYEEWRPPEPAEIEDFEGIEVPDLRFPGDRGTFELGEEGVEQARDFLVDHPRAEYDYSFDESTTDLTDSPDDTELYVDGSPLTEAHTDNDGNPDQGPLDFVYGQPETSPKGVQLAQRWSDALAVFGLPVEPRVVSFEALTQAALIQEDYDLTAFGWTRTGPNNDHFRQRFGRWGADLESEQDTIHFNTMGYTGADDLIEEQATMLDPDDRKPVVQQVLARIWADAPSDIAYHSQVLQPTNTEFEGWIETIGGVNNRNSWLNLRQRTE